MLLVDVIGQSAGWIDWQFFTSFDSRFPERAGIKAALFGTLYMMFFTMLIAVPTGVMSALYLEEYASDNWFTQFIQVNIANLAGVPSIVYGLLGLQVFVRYMDMGRSVLAGSCTMALLILPIIIVASREAIRAVPPSMREASFALGASKWETVTPPRAAVRTARYAYRRHTWLPPAQLERPRRSSPSALSPSCRFSLSTRWTALPCCRFRFSIGFHVPSRISMISRQQVS